MESVNKRMLHVRVIISSSFRFWSCPRGLLSLTVPGVPIGYILIGAFLPKPINLLCGIPKDNFFGRGRLRRGTLRRLPAE